MYNSITLIGHLGQNPETKILPSGSSLCNFSVATTEKWKDANGERQEQTTWHNITLWGKLGEIAQQYLRKGSKVMIVGTLQSRTGVDSEGITRRYYSVKGNEMKMLDGKPTTYAATSPTPAAAVQNSVAAQIPDAPVKVDGDGPLPF